MIRGKAILLGRPRGALHADVTDLLNYVHLDGRGCISFKGAHEWRYPVEPAAFVKHSLVRNSLVEMRLIQQGKLLIDPLISHILTPKEAPSRMRACGRTRMIIKACSSPGKREEFK